MLQRHAARRASMRLLAHVMAATACCLLAIAWAGSALASADTTYTATQTIPVPPESNFPGSGGGGDGWAVALSNTQLFNVFHHQSVLGVECHNQSDGSTCWPTDPTYITDGSGDNFATSGQPGMYLDNAQGKLYVYATRSSDDTAGVVCVDVSNPTANPTFCGFTALSAVGDGYVSGNGAISDPMVVGTKLYAFNYYPFAGVTGTRNQLMCFDLTTDAACTNQPYTVSLGLESGSTVDVSNFPAPATAAIDGKLFIPIADTDGNQSLACWDPSTGADCSGSWPISLNTSGYSAGNYGAPFPMLDGTGNEIGLCLPNPSAPCFDFTGASAATPANLPAALSGGSSTGWNGAGLVIGPRVYIPQWSTDVTCYDYSAGATCSGFPKYFSNLGLLYTVNADPQRPTCIWVNSDNGADQIQNFDAFGGSGCGEGAVRVLASQFIVPQEACFPTSYQSLQITDPPASDYDTSGAPTGSSITFEDADGNPIAGVPTEYLDNTGTVSLVGLSLDGPLGLPQFLISLNNPTMPITSITVKLTWTAAYDPSCNPSGGSPTPTSTSTSTQLSGGGSSGGSVTVTPGTAVTDQATVTGTDAAQATGTVTYSVYSDANCTTQVGSSDQESITTPGTIPGSQAVTLTNPGTYYWQATYSGDPGNDASSSACGSEVETVSGGGSPQYTSVTPVLMGGGQSAQQIIVPSGTSVIDTGTMTGVNSATAGGTLTYSVYSDPGCTMPAASSSTVNVTDGVIPNSAAVTLPKGTYFWQVSYSGDANNLPYTSVCGWETEVVLSTSHIGADIGTLLDAYPSTTEHAGTAFETDVVITNYGPKTAANVVVGLRLPSQLSIVDAGGGTKHGKLIIWKPGSVSAGLTITYHVWLSPSASASGSGMLQAGALSLGTLDSTYANNFASVGLTFAGTRHVAARRAHAATRVFRAELKTFGSRKIAERVRARARKR